jgi:hypothetical protein
VETRCGRCAPAHRVAVRSVFGWGRRRVTGLGTESRVVEQPVPTQRAKSHTLAPDFGGVVDIAAPASFSTTLAEGLGLAAF